MVLISERAEIQTQVFWLQSMYLKATILHYLYTLYTLLYYFLYLKKLHNLEKIFQPSRSPVENLKYPVPKKD